MLSNAGWIEGEFGAEMRRLHKSLLRARYNVAPGQMVLTITRGGATVVEASKASAGPPIAEEMHWGIDAPWSNGPSLLINARSDKLTESRFWKPLVEENRCVIPADGFYEWKAAAAKGVPKQPFLFTRSGGEGFGFAGLFRPTSDREQRECVIITVEPNDLVEGVYPRMPAMLTKQSAEQWLNGDAGEALSVLEPFDSIAMSARPISTAINNVKRDDAELIEQAPPPSTESSLF